jgi:hypothetical protein
VTPTLNTSVVTLICRPSRASGDMYSGVPIATRGPPRRSLIPAPRRGKVRSVYRGPLALVRSRAFASTVFSVAAAASMAA